MFCYDLFFPYSLYVVLLSSQRALNGFLCLSYENAKHSVQMFNSKVLWSHGHGQGILLLGYFSHIWTYRIPLSVHGWTYFSIRAKCK